MERLTERIGHRGAPREFPENSLPAFVRAFERGADAVELDVHATADGIVVVHHDPTVARSANAHPGVQIAALELEQLRAVEVAAGVGIPTLSDVLDVVPDGRRVYVEIKGVGIETHVADVLTNTRCDCAVHSFDHTAIERMRSIAPKIPRGILYDDRARDIADAMRRTGARDVWPNWRLIDTATVRQVQSAGGRVIAWTVNSPRTAHALIDLGVDGICTDDVRLILQERG